MDDINLMHALAVTLIALPVLVVVLGVKIVPQNYEYIVEQLGRYHRTLSPGLNYIVPIYHRVAAHVDIREAQHKQGNISVITKDNVQMGLDITVFYRVIDSAKQRYRIQDIAGAIAATAQSTVRAACGQLDFDEVQSRRDEINRRVKESLETAAEIWGVEITRAEILDVKVQESTLNAMMLQMNAERARRAAITEAEGKRDATKLMADGELYKAQRDADAIKIKADASAYSLERIGKAIDGGGKGAVEFQITKAQIEAVTSLAGSNNTKIMVLPTDLTKILGSIAAVIEGTKQ